MKRLYALLLLLLIAAGLFLNFPVASGLIREWLGLGHVVIGLLLALITKTLLTGNLTGYVVISITCSAAAELLQPFFGRSDSLSDLAFSISGALLLPIFQEKRLRLPLGAMSLVFFSTALTPLIKSSSIRLEQKAAFPLLFAADNPDAVAWTSRKTQKNLPQLPLEIAFDPLLQMKWSDYSRLEVDLNADQEGRRLSLRLDDNSDCREFADRLNHSWTTKAGNQTLRYDLKKHHMTDSLRPFNYCCVSRIILFSTEQDNGITLQNIRLRQ